MKIKLESNFKLLGSHNIDNIDLDVDEMTVKEFLQTISALSTKSPEYLNSDGTDLEGSLWQVYVNGRMLNFCEEGVKTLLRSGDTVAICTNVLEGCCGGALQGSS